MSLEMHDWQILSLHVQWVEGTLQINLRSSQGATKLVAKGLRHLRLPRREDWGPANTIQAHDGPLQVGGGRNFRLLIQIHSGDMVEIEAESFDLPF